MAESTSLNGPDIILWFDDLGSGNEDYNFLSNFYEGDPLTFEGITWYALLVSCGVKLESGVPLSIHKMLVANDLTLMDDIEFKTGEHAFAAMKFWGTDWTHFRDIVEAAGPNPAKALGRSRRNPLRPDWEVVKYDIMCAVTRAKYTLERVEGQRLMATDDRLLCEGTWWHDEIWGVNLAKENLKGRNWLGTILMARRAELRAYAAFPDSEVVAKIVGSTGTWNMQEGL